MSKDKKFDVDIKAGIAKEFSKLDELQTRMDNAIRKIMEKELGLSKLNKSGKKRVFGGYTVTNRYSDIMLPEKKKTTRIT